MIKFIKTIEVTTHMTIKEIQYKVFWNGVSRTDELKSKSPIETLSTVMILAINLLTKRYSLSGPVAVFYTFLISESSLNSKLPQSMIARIVANITIRIK